ncbi:MAG: hypothetical protein RBS27_07210 [Giesbergeria sp.]|jgi:hypothetical protein|nr:hypothetical protein [Giesbergeria sp.]
MSALHPPKQRPWRRWLATSLALLVLMAVFLLYSQPEFMLMLADQVWACF